MKIAIVGGRDFNDYELIKEKLIIFMDGNSTLINAFVSGGAKGADTLAEKFAAETGVEMIVYRPDFEKHGRGAALARNTQIVEHADVIFAFWDGKSRGTLDSITKAKQFNKKLFIINY